MRLILAMLLLCAGLCAQSPIVKSYPFMQEDGTPAVYALDAAGHWTIMEMSGERLDGELGTETYDWSYQDGKEVWTVYQNCKGLTEEQCLKTFMRRVKALKKELGLT